MFEGETFVERMKRFDIIRGSGPWKLLRAEHVEAMEREKNEDERGKDPGGGDEPDAEHGEGEEGREHRSKVPPAAPS